MDFPGKANMALLYADIQISGEYILHVEEHCYDFRDYEEILVSHILEFDERDLNAGRTAGVPHSGYSLKDSLHLPVVRLPKSELRAICGVL